MAQETTFNRLCYIVCTSTITALLTGTAIYFAILNKLPGDTVCSYNQTSPGFAPVAQAKIQLPDRPALIYWRGAYNSYNDHGHRGHTARWRILSQSSSRQESVISLNNVTGTFQLRVAGFYDININLYWKKANCQDTDDNFLFICLDVNGKNIDCRVNTNNKDRSGSFTLSLTSPRSEFYSANAKVKVVMNTSGKCISTDETMSNIEIIYRGARTGRFRYA